VAVAAHDRHAWLRQTKLRADDVDDALFLPCRRVELDAELATVFSSATVISSASRRETATLEAVGTM